MIVLVGGTGLLGSRIAERLQARGERFRALVRPATDAAALNALGAEIVRGDLRDSDSLEALVRGASTVVTTATAVSRVLAGEKTSLREIDDEGNADLIRVAEAAGVQRFVFLSFYLTPGMARLPLPEAKRATENRLARSRMRDVIIRPDLFQEVWLSKAVQFDPTTGKVQIFGKGDAPHAYVAVDDVAAAVVQLALDGDPPREVTFGGPEALTRNEVVARFERVLKRPIKARHVPRWMLRAGAVGLRRVKPVAASLMGMALEIDERPIPLPAQPLRELGIEPRPVSVFIDGYSASR